MMAGWLLPKICPWCYFARHVLSRCRQPCTGQAIAPMPLRMSVGVFSCARYLANLCIVRFVEGRDTTSLPPVGGSTRLIRPFDLLPARESEFGFLGLSPFSNISGFGHLWP